VPVPSFGTDDAEAAPLEVIPEGQVFGSAYLDRVVEPVVHATRRRERQVMTEYPQLLHTVLDTTDVRGLAEFYRQLLGLRYRPGDEAPADVAADEADWLVLVDANGARKLAFQFVDRLERTTWPAHDVPMQLHVDYTVSSVDELRRQRERAESLGAQVLLDRTDDESEPLYVFADPSGHPFCIFVA
jgi:catechol 2,3-dioxygenase-like lactoylglutathione lyase family enzyme